MVKQNTDLPLVTIYTDGACSGNPGPGGWAAVLYSNGHQHIVTGSEAMTTNNRMELMAAIAALSALKERSDVSLTTDSKYVKDGIERWLSGWKQRNWKTSAGKLVKNRDLWEQLDQLTINHIICWHWVRGHSVCVENKRVDCLARKALQSQFDKKLS